MQKTLEQQLTGLFRFYDANGYFVRGMKHPQKKDVLRILAMGYAYSVIYWAHPDANPKAFQYFEGNLYRVAITEVRWDRYQP